jgi:ATP diphosphatase
VLRGEIDELINAGSDSRAVLHEVGDVLFTAVNVSRQYDVDPEVALRAAVERFRARFTHMEREFARNSESMREASPEQLEQAWEEAKRT